MRRYETLSNVHVSFYPIVLLHSMIGYWQNPVICAPVCNAVHCGSRGRCTGLAMNSVES